MNIAKRFLMYQYRAACRLNERNIASLLEHNPDAAFIDLGCDDGDFSLSLANQIGTEKVSGVEIVTERLALAREQGLTGYAFDLNGSFDLGTEAFDVVHANQVIEHLSNSDAFLDEIYRILNPGGYAVISTENASSWCNIAASMLGLQIFSLTNFSSKRTAIGNPFNLHNTHGDRIESWNHVRIYNVFGLRDYFKVAGFQVEAIRGAGYFPLPAFFGRIDYVHSHYMTFKIRKPTETSN
jgi:SAM-dependent methyltransferase